MQNLKNRDEAVVVFSGGQDSTTCLLWALKKYKKVYPVFKNHFYSFHSFAPLKILYFCRF